MRLSSILSGKPHNSQSDISLQLNGLKLPITCNFISFCKFGITKALSFQKEELLFYLKCVINNHESHDFVLIYVVFFNHAFQLLSSASSSGSALWKWHCHSWWHPVLSRYVKSETLMCQLLRLKQSLLSRIESELNIFSGHSKAINFIYCIFLCFRNW